jgi:topoisomerase IA-like protein
MKMVNSIFCGSGKYGPYVKIQEGKKYRYAPLKDGNMNILLEDAIKLLQFPKVLGKMEMH